MTESEATALRVPAPAGNAVGPERIDGVGAGCGGGGPGSCREAAVLPAPPLPAAPAAPAPLAPPPCAAGPLAAGPMAGLRYPAAAPPPPPPPSTCAWAWAIITCWSWSAFCLAAKLCVVWSRSVGRQTLGCCPNLDTPAPMPPTPLPTPPPTPTPPACARPTSWVPPCTCCALEVGLVVGAGRAGSCNSM